MTVKFIYQVVLDENEQPDGTRQVMIKAVQKENSALFGTNIFVKPENFSDGVVVDHPLADKYNVFIYKTKNDIESTELDVLSKRGKVTPMMLSYIINDKISATVPIEDFTTAVMKKSDRQPGTVLSYVGLVKHIKAYSGEKTCIEDINYDWIMGFQKYLQEKKLSRNTIIGKLKLVRALINEAIKRRLISRDDDPFVAFHIPCMSCKRGFLEYEELDMLTSLKLKKKREIRIRDAFLFCCYTGLRYSDMLTLSEAKFKDGWIYKTMHKTKFDVSIPYTLIFDGKAVDLINKYGGDIKTLSKIGNNSTLNRTLKDIAKRAGIPKKVTFHLARHTCATLLLREGVPITTVMFILGHQKIETTMIYAETTEKTVLSDLQKAFTVSSTPVAEIKVDGPKEEAKATEEKKEA